MSEPLDVAIAIKGALRRGEIAYLADNLQFGAMRFVRKDKTTEPETACTLVIKVTVRRGTH